MLAPRVAETNSSSMVLLSLSLSLSLLRIRVFAFFVLWILWGVDGVFVVGFSYLLGRVKASEGRIVSNFHRILSSELDQR